LSHVTSERKVEIVRANDESPLSVDAHSHAAKLETEEWRTLLSFFLSFSLSFFVSSSLSFFLSVLLSLCFTLSGYNTNPSFEHTLEARFDFGLFTFHFNVNKNTITAVEVYSDSLDLGLVDDLKTELLGLAYTRDAVYSTV